MTEDRVIFEQAAYLLTYHANKGAIPEYTALIERLRQLAQSTQTKTA